jgi:DNA polymerase III subunit gamma/tau
VWDIKYRPKKFSDVLGQEGNVRLLKARLSRGTAFDTSYLFMGGHGQGKTTLGRIHARAMLCSNLNKEDPEPCNECENCLACLRDQSEAFSERDAASQGKIEHIRALVEKLGFAVGNAKMRIELFDEAHRIGDGAQDVLLKPLEEKKLVGMFCTTEPNKIKGTIRTRCEEYVIRKVTREDILKRAKFIAENEGVSADDDALLTIIDASGGHVRDIINKMEMVAQVGAINISNTREYLHLSAINIYYDILLALSEPARAIELIDQACENVAPEEVVSGIAEAAMNSYRLANSMYTEFVAVDRELGKRVYERYGLGTVRLASYFLENRYASRVTLMRDVLLLTQLEGNLPPAAGLQPVTIMVGGVTSPNVQAVSTAPLSSPTPTTAPTPTQSVAPQVAVALATPVAAPAAPMLNGHGGSKPDPRLHQFGPTDWGEPRKRSDAPNHPVFNGSNDQARRLQPDEWAREFRRKWPGTHD